MNDDAAALGGFGILLAVVCLLFVLRYRNREIREKEKEEQP